MEDDHGKTEEEYEEVPEGQSRQDAVPRALQVQVVPHDAHERQVAHHARREQHQRQQHDCVRPVGAVGDREERVEEPRAVARRGVTHRSWCGEVAVRVVVPPRVSAAARCVRVSFAEVTVSGTSSDPVEVGKFWTGERILCSHSTSIFRPLLLEPGSGLKLPGCGNTTGLHGPHKEEKE